MSYPADPSGCTPLTEAEARDRLRMAVHMRLRVLRRVPWRKGMTLEDVLKHYGVEAFADGLADHLFLCNLALFEGPQPIAPTVPPVGKVP